jgi:hypothetical protein
VYVGRPTEWGNQFVAGKNCMWMPETGLPFPLPTSREVGSYEHGITVVECTPELTVEWFAAYMGHYPSEQAKARANLAGKDLACWCKPGQPCHADVLLRIANGGVA